MAHTATVDLDDLATLAGACNIAHAPDAKDIAALHVRTLTIPPSSFSSPPCSTPAEPCSGLFAGPARQQLVPPLRHPPAGSSAPGCIPNLNHAHVLVDAQTGPLVLPCARTTSLWVAIHSVRFHFILFERDFVSRQRRRRRGRDDAGFPHAQWPNRVIPASLGWAEWRQWWTTVHSGPSGHDDNGATKHESGAPKLDLVLELSIPSCRPPSPRTYRHRVRSDRNLLCDFRSVLHKPPAAAATAAATATATAATAFSNVTSDPTVLPSAGPGRRLLSTICASRPAESCSRPWRCAEPQPAFVLLHLEPLQFTTPVLSCVEKASTSSRAGQDKTRLDR